MIKDRESLKWSLLVRRGKWSPEKVDVEATMDASERQTSPQSDRLAHDALHITSSIPLTRLRILEYMHIT